MTLQQIIDSACESFDEKFGNFDADDDGGGIVWNDKLGQGEEIKSAIKSHLISSIKKAVEEAYEEIEEIVATEMDNLSVKTTNAEFVACDELAINIINKLRQKHEVHKN